MTTIPFDPPTLYTAERKAGFVDITSSAVDDGPHRGWDVTVGTVDTEASSSPSASTQPPRLERKQTMSGNILIVSPTTATTSDDTTEGPSSPSAYWLQRKIGKTGHGLMRLGYKLKFKQEEGGCWELHTDNDGRQTVVTVYMMHTSVLDDNKRKSTRDDDDSVGAGCHSPVDELSALQMIAKYDPTETAHVVGTNIVATCSQHLYAILPYHRDGNLLEFCQTVGCFEEPLARFIFQQIVQVSFHTT
jgi:hypothetical protein